MKLSTAIAIGVAGLVTVNAALIYNLNKAEECAKVPQEIIAENIGMFTDTYIKVEGVHWVLSKSKSWKDTVIGSKVIVIQGNSARILDVVYNTPTHVVVTTGESIPRSQIAGTARSDRFCKIYNELELLNNKNA